MQPSPSVSIEEEEGKAIHGARRGCQTPISQPDPGTQSRAAFPCEPPGSAGLQGIAAEPQAGTGSGAAAGHTALQEPQRGWAAGMEEFPAEFPARILSSLSSRVTNAFPVAGTRLPLAVGAFTSLPLLLVVHTALQSVAAAVFPAGLWMQVPQHHQQCHTRRDSTGWAWCPEQPLPPSGLSQWDKISCSPRALGKESVQPSTGHSSAFQTPSMAQCSHQPPHFGGTEDGTATRRAFLSPWKC